MSRNIRTDLALEATELWRESAQKGSELKGVKSTEEQRGNFKVTEMEVLDKNGEASLGKPCGRYITVELDALIKREENSFSEASALIAEKLSGLCNLVNNDICLVVGLGNEAITPDAIGPETLKSILVTRHLKKSMPKEFSSFRDVSASRAGVLGTTGVESAEVVNALSRTIRPNCIIAIDALASRRSDRLCRTVQMTDTGIVPGSGVGNHRAALNRDSLGIPVIAIGIPTVVDAATLAIDLVTQAGAGDLNDLDFGEAGNMIVTPRDIDRNVHDIAKLVGYAINLAMHKDLCIEDLDMLI